MLKIQTEIYENSRPFGRLFLNKTYKLEYFITLNALKRFKNEEDFFL